MESDSHCLLVGVAKQRTGDCTRIAPIIATGLGPVDGDPRLNSSTWAELFGIASALQFLQEFLKSHNIDTESKLIIWSDSMAAIARLGYLLLWTLHLGRPPDNADRHSVFTCSPA
jgi:hypothetical protein